MDAVASASKKRMGFPSSILPAYTFPPIGILYIFFFVLFKLYIAHLRMLIIMPDQIPPMVPDVKARVMDMMNGKKVK